MRWVALPLVLAVSLAAAPARAQGVAHEADLLFKRGGQLFAAGKHEDALLAYLGSNRLVRNKNALYNIALCYQSLKQYRDAYRFLAEYAKEPLSPPERTVAQEQLDRIRPRLALVTVTAEPAGASVYVDRKDLGALGAAPSTLAVAPGPRTVIVELPGYHEEQRRVEARVGQLVTVALRLRPVLGGVYISGQPRGAEIRVDRDHGAAAAVTPAFLELAPGRHTVYVSRDGYRPARTDLAVAARQTSRIDVLLERLPTPPGKLVVTANLRGALVLVDGQPAGLAPVTLDVPAGPHRVGVTLEDYAPFARDVTVAAGQRVPVEVVLSLASEFAVAAASKMVQGVEEAPGAITVITGEEIQAFGYRTLGEVLRGVRGFYLSDDRQYQNVGVRGFSPPGDYNTRLLLLSDGHTMNDLWVGQAAAGHDFAVDLDDVERVEVVRGPGSALYGTGAFFGVVDVTTRLREERRLEVGGAAGGLGEGYGRATVAQELGQRGALRLAGAGLYSPRGGTFTDAQTGTAIAGNDGERAVSLAAKATLGELLVLARFNDRKKSIPTDAFVIVPGTGRSYVHDQRTFFEVRWERAVSDATRVVVRGYYDRSRYDGRWPYSDVATEDLHDSGGADWAGAEGRAIVKVRPWLTVVTGLEGMVAPVVRQKANDATGTMLDSANALGVGAVYALGEARLARTLRVTAGVRGDYYSTTGAGVSPNVAAVWRSYARGITKLMFGRGYRAPSIYELYFHDGGVTQVPSDHLGAETIYTWEAEHTHAFGGRVFATVSGYFNDVRGLVSLGPAGTSSVACQAAEGCVQYRNLGHVGTLGGELELRRSWGPDGSLALAYAFQRSRDLSAGPMFGAGAQAILNSPEHLAQVKLARPVVARLLTLGAEVDVASPRLRRDGSRTSSMVLANLTLSGRVRTAGLRYSLGMYNLLDWRYGAPVGAEYPDLTQEIQQAGRAFLARLAASF
jgi:outer membrane receptor protein involved in Fe transport